MKIVSVYMKITLTYIKIIMIYLKIMLIYMKIILILKDHGNSHLELFYIKVFRKNFTKLAGKYLS